MITVVRTNDAAGNGSNVRSVPTPPANARRPPPRLPTKQDALTEETFAQTLDGFEQVEARDLLEARGGRVRYVIEEAGGRKRYRLGGFLQKVDPFLRYLCLFNPYAKRRGSVQLAPPGQRVRPHYLATPTSDESAMIRSLAQQLDNGDITLRRRG